MSSASAAAASDALGSQVSHEELAQLRDRVGAERQARRHGVAAAGQQQPVLERRLDRAAQVDARLRAARALADARDRIDADDDGGLAIALAQPAGDDADHARMPALARDHMHRARPGSRLASASMRPTASSDDVALRRPCAAALRASSSSASARASSGSSVDSSRAPRSERPMRPPALIRGPRMKPAWKTLAGPLGRRPPAAPSGPDCSSRTSLSDPGRPAPG